MSSSADCIFCKIAAGDIPATMLYRDEHVIAIADLNAQAPTHLLVMPVEHYANVNDFVADASPEAVAALWRTAARLGREHGAEGFRLVVNTGSHGGQTVDHLHVHVLAGRPMHWPPG